MLPGISQRMLKKLKKQDLEVVKEHIELFKEGAQKKKNVLDGKFEELGEFLKHPRNEAEQLTRVIRDVEKAASSGLLASLFALEVNARELMRSIDEELKLIRAVEKAKAVQKEIEGELILATIIEHQLSLIIDIQTLSRATIEKANEIKNSKKRSEVARNSVNLNNIGNFLGRIIFDEQIPNLAVAYNMLRLKEWDEIEARIMQVKNRFPEIGEHLL